MSEAPWPLPEGWRWVKLGEVCRINPRRPRLRLSADQPVTFVPMRAVDEKTGTITSAEERPFEQVRSGYTYFQDGDVLFARITPCMENGKSAVARGLLNGFGFGTTEFHVLRPDKDVLAEWVWLFVRRSEFRREAKAAMQGAVGHQRVPAHFLEEHPLPLPPLDEQRRIVARIEALMERIREAKRLREEARADAERLWQAVLADTFPRPGEDLPEGWRWVKLGEVAKTYSGVGFPKRYQGSREAPFPFLKVADLNAPVNDPIVCRAENYVDENVLRATKARLAPEGSIVFPKIGGAIYTNKKRLLGVACAFDNNIMAVVPDGNLVSPWYLLYWFTGVDLKHLIQPGPVPSLRQSAVRSLSLPLPPQNEQKRIVAHLEAVQERIREMTQAQEDTVEKLQALERSILDRAFRGEL